MSRLTFIWFILYLLHIYCYRYSLTQDLSQIKPAIEKERQIVRIRNEILKALHNNGARIRSDVINRIELDKEAEPAKSTKEEINSDTNTDIRTGHDTHSRSVALVTLGEPIQQARDKCLAFHIRNYVKNVEYIIPKKIDLWIHIRKRDNRKNKKKNNKISERMLKNSSDEKKKDEERGTGKEKKRGRRKNRKKRHGRRIKIFISDGTKTLVKMRMRIRKTKWYKIELPISQFPDVISVNDSFKLCFKCKRCGKKVKLDLHRDAESRLLNPSTPKPRLDHPTIPFIHFEEHRSQHTYRYKRSNDVKRSNGVITIKHRHHHFERSRSSQIKKTCCQEEIYTEEITKLFPNIVYPESVNISHCTGNSYSFEDQPLLSQTGTSQTPLNTVGCVPNIYKPFNFVYVNNNFKIKHASIPDLIPVGCSCRIFT